MRTANTVKKAWMGKAWMGKAGVRVGALALSVLAGAALGAEDAPVRGEIARVTVYQGEALVTRSVEVDGASGPREIVVGELPPMVQASSLFAQSDDGLTVRAVRFRTRPVAQDVREDVRAIDLKLQELSDQLAAINAERATLEERRGVLKRIEDFGAPSAQAELKSGVLNAKTLIELTEYLGAQRKEMSLAELELNTRTRDVQGKIEQAQRERAVITGGSARTVNEAVVFVNKTAAGKATLNLSYIVDNAGWTPSYSVRQRTGAARAEGALTGGGQRLTLESYASVQQASGEDWSGVTLELSTATPMLAAKAPELKPVRLALATVEVAAQNASSAITLGQQLGYRDAKRELMRQRGDIETQYNVKLREEKFDDARLAETAPGGEPRGPSGSGGGGGGRAPGAGVETLALNTSLNDFAKQELLLDLIAGEAVRPAEQLAKRPGFQEGLSVTYAIAGETSMASRPDRQLIQIATHEMSAEYYKLAQPSLTKSVYNEARAVNESGLVLLGGPFNAFVDGEFKGSGRLPTVAAGEAFTVGFGIDTSLRAYKVLTERNDRVQGGNRIVDLSYELRVENFGDSDARVRVLDAVPTGESGEIRVTAGKSVPEAVRVDGTPRSAGARDANPGVWRWDLVVPGSAVKAGGPGAAATGVAAGATTGSATAVYSFTLEHDRQMNVIVGE